MGKFRKCVNCNYYNYGKLEDEDSECILFGYNTCEDKKGNQGCYRTDKTLDSIADKILEYIRSEREKEDND